MKVVKTIAAIAAGTIMMGSSPTRPVPIYVHCKAPTQQIAQTACMQLVKNLRDRGLHTSVAPLHNLSDRAGVGMHITFHLIAIDSRNFDSFLSWGSAGNEPLAEQNKGPEVKIKASDVGGDFNTLLDKLVVISNIPL